MNEKLSMSELGRMTKEEFQRSEKKPVILILDNIRSGLNVGSIFRSADAFRIEKIYCCGYTPVPPHREVLKSALGATETVVWEQQANALEVVQQLREKGVLCYAVEQTNNSIPLHKFFPSPENLIALVVGNEVTGVAQDVINACDGTVEIVQHGTKHSLNVAVCAGIILFDVTNKITVTNK